MSSWIHKSILLLLLVVGATGCAAEVPASDGAEQTESALLGRTTTEICDAVETRWGDRWEISDVTGDKRAAVADALSCANRLYWRTRYRPAAVHAKYYLHRRICLSNPASHLAMRAEQADFYCALSLHFRMCNTQGLYALRGVIDVPARRARENAIFHECLALSGESSFMREGLRLGGEHRLATSGADDAEVAAIVERLYDDYKVKPGVRVAPASVNPDRARHALLERILRVSYYGVTIPLELIESSFADLFLLEDGVEHESQLALLAFYRSRLMNVGGKNLLDPTGLQ